MRLAEIELRNWKGYRRTRLELPTAHDRNVVVVEGNNGAGKTSLLEAVTLCLYGRAGLPLIARASGNGRPEHPYDAFLERALSMEARGAAARSAVTLRFEAPGRQLAVERVWHFSATGRHRRDDEEVRLYDGPDGDLVPLLGDDAERAAGVRDWISGELIPENLAGFFILDGEHLERMAGASAEALIKEAVDTALGAAALRGLAADLRSYARERRRQATSGGEGGKAGLEALAAIEAEERTTSAEVGEIMAELAPLRAVRDAVVRRIGSLHGESYRNFKTLFEDRERSVRERDRQREELRRLLAGDLALALAGGTLRQRAADRIAAEADAAARSRDDEVNRSRLDDFIAALARSAPALVAEHGVTIASAWDEVWTPGPSRRRVEARFTHLGEAERRAVVDHLSRLSSVEAGGVAALARSVTDEDEKIASIEREVARQRGLDGDAQALADELSAVQARMAALEARHATRVSALGELQRRAAAARAGLDAAAAEAEAAAPMLGRAARAEAYATLAEQVTAAAMPQALASLSRRITAAYTAMAHKSVVRSVHVHPDGRVELLDADGRDLRQVDASAGESQVLALAVMSALSTFAPDFPIIVDTPLARLDPMHRANVLTHFAEGGRQLILLIHPAELGSAEQAIIANRVAGTVELVTRSGPPAAASA